MAKFEIYINSARGMEKTGSVAGSMEEAKAMIKSWGGNPNEYANYVIKTPEGKHVDYRDSAFTDEKWGVWKSGGAIGEKTNYFVVENLSEEEAKERAKGRNDRRSAGDKTYYKLKYTAKKMSDTEVADGRRLEYEDDLVVVKRGSEVLYKGLEDYNPMSDEDWVWNNSKGCYELRSDKSVTLTVLDSTSEVKDGKIVGGEGRSMDGIPYGLYQEGGRSYRGFEITSNENGLRKGVYRFYNWGGGVPFGNAAVDGQFTEAQFQKLIGEGKVKLLDSETSFGMEDDIVKSGSGYTNKGKEGTHGQFATKKEAAAQTRAMYANGYKGDATEKEFKIYVKGPFGSYKVAEWSAVSKEAAVKEFLEMNPAYKNKGIIEARDAATIYAPIVDAGEDVKVGQQYQNARLATLTVTNITNSGNVEWQFSRDGDVYGASVSGFKTMLAKNGYRKIKDSTKMFKVVDKATGKTLLVKATDSLAAVKRVSSLKDTAYTVTACTNDFPYGNNVAVIVDANSEDEAVAKYRKVIEARGDKINYISATPTTSSDIAKGISRFKN